MKSKMTSSAPAATTPAAGWVPPEFIQAQFKSLGFGPATINSIVTKAMEWGVCVMSGVPVRFSHGWVPRLNRLPPDVTSVTLEKHVLSPEAGRAFCVDQGDPRATASFCVTWGILLRREKQQEELARKAAEFGTAYQKRDPHRGRSGGGYVHPTTMEKGVDSQIATEGAEALRLRRLAQERERLQEAAAAQQASVLVAEA